MIIEAIKIAGSLWPLAKEVFLWHDGAQVGKPITDQNLIRRKIAVFALIASILVNYFLVSQFIIQYNENEKQKNKLDQLIKDDAALQKQNDELKNKTTQCVDPTQLNELLAQDHAFVEHYCKPPDQPGHHVKRKK